MKYIFLCLLIPICVSCASSRKNKITTGMAVSFVTGYAAGQSSAPDGENKNMHGALYGSAFSAIVGATLIHFFNESEELKETKNKVIELSDRIKNQNRNKVTVNRGLVSSKTDQLPSDIKKLIKPGTWKLFEIDEWIRKGNVLIHRDRELHFEPSKLMK